MQDQNGLKFPAKLLNGGFVFALVLAGVSLLASATYLVSYLISVERSLTEFIPLLGKNTQYSDYDSLIITTRVFLTRMTLRSCGVFMGMSFGFLGFALFLLGVKGEMDVDLSSERFSLRLARLAPGAFILLCATVLVALCVVYPAPFNFRRQASQNEGSNNTTNSIREDFDDRNFKALLGGE